MHGACYQMMYALSVKKSREMLSHIFFYCPHVKELLETTMEFAKQFTASKPSLTCENVILNQVVPDVKNVPELCMLTFKTICI